MENILLQIRIFKPLFWSLYKINTDIQIYEKSKIFMKLFSCSYLSDKNDLYKYWPGFRLEYFLILDKFTICTVTREKCCIINIIPHIWKIYDILLSASSVLIPGSSIVAVILKCDSIGETCIKVCMRCRWQLDKIFLKPAEMITLHVTSCATRRFET